MTRGIEAPGRAPGRDSGGSDRHAGRCAAGGRHATRGRHQAVGRRLRLQALPQQRGIHDPGSEDGRVGGPAQRHGKRRPDGQGRPRVRVRPHQVGRGVVPGEAPGPGSHPGTDADRIALGPGQCSGVPDSHMNSKLSTHRP